MLNENKFDIVSICTPIQTHFEIVKKCIETGVKAIFCEKTLSYSLEEAEEMLRLCKENNVIFGINYILRWDILNEYVNSIDKLNILRKSVEELLAEYNEHISKKIKNIKQEIYNIDLEIQELKINIKKKNYILTNRWIYRT